MRSALLTLLVAAAVGAAVLGAGWAVQAAALPAPERADLVAAHAASWLSRYRFVVSAFAVGGEPAVHAQCLQGWFSPDGRAKRPGMVLHFGRHAAVVALAGRPLDVLAVPGGEHARLAAVQLALAGCPHLVSREIVAALDSQRGIRSERATVADHPAIALDVPVEHGRMQVYVTPRTYRPIAISLDLSRFSGRGRIRLTPLTPALLTAFDNRG
ncbi:MAG TPA: hypothetical protein VMU58_05955 [Gaiellaceae bacterium]|nr:hypothetical protein [Gaiellaceae bacterium]